MSEWKLTYERPPFEEASHFVWYVGVKMYSGELHESFYTFKCLVEAAGFVAKQFSDHRGLTKDSIRIGQIVSEDKSLEIQCSKCGVEKGKSCGGSCPDRRLRASLVEMIKRDE
jgi:hypothetical protein